MRLLDEAQQHAVDRLQRLYESLLESEARKSGFLHKLFGRKQHYVHGLYLWGGVGRGKSFLMDVFFSSVPLDNKKRVHFHRFMQDVHAELDTIKHHADPLVIVAQRIAQQARLICFDEFHVSDIADAMLLGRLLGELLQQGVVLVATSNHKPDELYMVDEKGLRAVMPGEIAVTVGGGQPTDVSAAEGTTVQKVITLAGDKLVVN